MQWLAVRKFLVKSGGPCQHQVLGNKKGAAIRPLLSCLHPQKRYRASRVNREAMSVIQGQAVQRAHGHGLAYCGMTTACPLATISRCTFRLVM